MAKKKMVPELRFRGFIAEWDQKKIENLALQTYGGGTPNTLKDEYWNGNIAWIQSSDISEEQLSGIVPKKFVTKKGILASATKLIPENSIAIVTRVGVGKVALMTYCYTTSQDFLSLSKLQIDNWYAVYAIYRLLHNEIHSLQGTSIKGITKDILLSKPINISSIDDEQIKVGEFFKNIDTLITLRQKKYNRLIIKKRAMLEKMFPKEGANIPEIRFMGFTDNWEMRKLTDNLDNIIDFRGRTPKKLGLDWSDKGYLALSALNVKNGYIDFDVDAHYGNQELYDKWMLGNELHKNQVLFTTEAPMGNVAQIPDNNKYILSQRTIAFEVNQKIIAEDYLSIVFSLPAIQKKLNSLSSGGTAKGISQKSLARLEVFVPKDIREQKKIGRYFRSLETIISLHQRELDKLKSIKKAFLEKMFI